MATRLDAFAEANSDAIEDLDAEITLEHPELPLLIAAAQERRALLRELASERRRARVGQGEIARRMGTSQSFVSRLERGMVDPQHSTEDRYAAALGLRVERRLVRA
jgi:DNA-binding transcriptional regulator YiaG